MANKKISIFFITIAMLFTFISCSSIKSNRNGIGSTKKSGDKSTDYGFSATDGNLDFPDEKFSETVSPDTIPSTASSESERPILTDSFTQDAKAAGEPTTVSEYGFTPLPCVTLKVPDPDNSKGIPTARIEHSYGVAKDGKPHLISVDNQNFFDSKGYKALAYDKKTQSKVLYLTFDCGWENGYTSKVLDVLKEKKVPAAFFCTLDHLEAEPELIARMIREGHTVGNHSDSHADFSKLTRTQMAKEIESCDNFLRENFGYTSNFFRFPEGSYSENALDLVQSIGFVSVFWSCSYADWDVNSVKGANYAFETVTARLHPGAVILLHAVSPDNAGAMADIIDFARAQGYEFRSLDSYKF